MCINVISPHNPYLQLSALLFALVASGLLHGQEIIAATFFENGPAVEFGLDNAQIVVQGTFEYIQSNEPDDGVGDLGKLYSLEFHPEVVLKGSLDADRTYEIQIPNRYLSYQLLPVSRDEMFFLRQEGFQEIQKTFSENYFKLQSIVEEGGVSGEEFYEIAQFSDLVAKEILAITPVYRVHRSPLRPDSEIPANKIILPGNVYTLLLEGDDSENPEKLSLYDNESSIYGGLDSLFIKLLLKK